MADTTTAPRRWPRRIRRWVGALALATIALAAGGWVFMIRMPGTSYRGTLPPLSKRQHRLALQLGANVETLATGIGVREVLFHYEALQTAAHYVEGEFRAAGYRVSRQDYLVEDRTCTNLEVELPGTEHPDEIVVVGAHYDSALDCPAANDNGTGVAALLALARSFAGLRPQRTLHFVAFTNEEPAHFQTEAMGSLVYARRLKNRGKNVVAMLSLETMGYYSDLKGSQSYPFPFSLLYPSQGDFIAFVGNVPSRDLVRRAVRTFREQAKFPSEGAAVPSAIPGVGWSDHWSFWQSGYPAVMVTDTAPFRYPHYHTPQDTPDKVDLERLARVVEGLEKVVADLAGVEPSSEPDPEPSPEEHRPSD